MSAVDPQAGVGQPSAQAPAFTAAEAGFAPPPPDPADSVPPAAAASEVIQAAPERVGLGLLFSLGGIVVGIVGAVLFKSLDDALNFNSMKLEIVLAMVPSALMAFSSVWLYTKGSGGALRKGVVPLIVVLLVGVAAVVTTALATDAATMAVKIYPGNTTSQVSWVISFVADQKVWVERKESLLVYVIAAAAGTFGALYGRLKGKR
jgi:hypothetical protein